MFVGSNSPGIISTAIFSHNRSSKLSNFLTASNKSYPGPDTFELIVLIALSRFNESHGMPLIELPKINCITCI